MIIHNNEELILALNNQEKTLDIVENTLQLDRLESECGKCKLILHEGLTLYNVNGEILCRVIEGTAISFLGGYKEDANGNEIFEEEQEPEPEEPTEPIVP